MANFQKKLVLAVSIVFLINYAVVYSRPNRRACPESSGSSGVSVSIPPRPVTELENRNDQGQSLPSAPFNRTTILDAKKFRGATGRYTRSGGYIDNGMGGMGTALLLQQIMASQNAAANNANGNCTSDDTPKSGMDMQAIMPMILAMQNQGTYRGGYSG